MRKLLFSLCMVPLLGACGTIGTPKPNEIGSGEYFLYRYPGNLPHVAYSPPAEWTGKQFDQLQYLDADCRAQMRPQVPSAAKSVGTTMVRNLPGMILGTAAGAKWAFGSAVSATAYGKYGGVAGAGNVIGTAIDRHAAGNRDAVGGCMTYAVNYAHSRDHQLSGIGVIYNVDAVNGRPLRRPGPGEEVRAAPPPNQAPDQDDVVPPPH